MASSAEDRSSAALAPGPHCSAAPANGVAVEVTFQHLAVAESPPATQPLGHEVMRLNWEAAMPVIALLNVATMATS